MARLEERPRKDTLRDAIEGLESQIYDLFQGGGSEPWAFAARFDGLANYLREQQLGCNWAFMTYLAFLVDSKCYFPIRPSSFDRVLKFYGNEVAISGRVSWQRYALLLDLANLVRDKLSAHVAGDADTLAIQSYMWVVSYLLLENPTGQTNPVTEPDWSGALDKRRKRATRDERTGLLGERYVYAREKSRLTDAGREDLAARVELVSESSADSGYDILSYQVDSRPIHIEVKTTERAIETGWGFWLSDHERKIAHEDPYWRLYRVWGISDQPRIEDLGNIVTANEGEWQLRPSTWWAHRHDETEES